jgi:tryptophan-rich sensory protein
VVERLASFGASQPTDKDITTCTHLTILASASAISYCLQTSMHSSWIRPRGTFLFTQVQLNKVYHRRIAPPFTKEKYMFKKIYTGLMIVVAISAAVIVIQKIFESDEDSEDEKSE